MVAATRRTKARRDIRKTSRAGQEVCLKTRVCPPQYTTRTSNTSNTYLTSPVCFPRRLAAARYSSSHGAEWRGGGGLWRLWTVELPIPPPPLRPGGSANTLHGIWGRRSKCEVDFAAESVRACAWSERPHGILSVRTAIITSSGARFTSNNNVTLNLHHRGFFSPSSSCLPPSAPQHTYHTYRHVS